MAQVPETQKMVDGLTAPAVIDVSDALAALAAHAPIHGRIAQQAAAWGQDLMSSEIVEPSEELRQLYGEADACIAAIRRLAADEVKTLRHLIQTLRRFDAVRARIRDCAGRCGYTV